MTTFFRYLFVIPQKELLAYNHTVDNTRLPKL